MAKASYRRVYHISGVTASEGESVAIVMGSMAADWYVHAGAVAENLYLICKQQVERWREGGKEGHGSQE